MDSQTEHPLFSRLIVLLPESVAGNMEFAARIHWIALREQKAVLYLTILDNPGNTLGVSRLLTTMKAVTSFDNLRASSMQVAAERWLDKLLKIIQPGDTLVCHEEQLVKTGRLKTTSMPVFLAEKFTNLLIVERGYFHPERVIAVNGLQRLLFWVGTLAILAGFTYLEIQTGILIRGFVSKLILMIFITLEFGAVWIWNQLIQK